MKKSSFVVGVLAGVAGTLAAQTYRRFQRDRQRQLAEVAVGSRLIQTARGWVEYAVMGTGVPMLSIHGVSGGYDVPVQVFPLLERMQLIAPSRPGYLRTPLSSGHTPREQAALYAALLDELGIERVAIVGASGGGPSALEFALHYPHRCYAAVFASAASLAVPPYSLIARVGNTLLREHDFASWWITHARMEWAMQRSGIIPAVRARLKDEPHLESIVRALIQIGPVSVRRVGLLNDFEQGKYHLPITGLEQMTVPTLVIHGALDSIVPVSHGDYIAHTVPGATYLRLEDGGHLCMVTHAAQAFTALNHFIHKHAESSEQ